MFRVALANSACAPSSDLPGRELLLHAPLRVGPLELEGRRGAALAAVLGGQELGLHVLLRERRRLEVVRDFLP